MLYVLLRRNLLCVQFCAIIKNHNTKVVLSKGKKERFL